MKKFSIIINNYNYGQYLKQCIDSAISQDYSNFEVIVVDDGSTDDSRAVIEAYGDRLKTVFKQNGGQGSAYNAGWAVSSGEIVIFLDSDDALMPSALQKISEGWTDSNSKMHWLLTLIDDKDNPLGGVIPSSLDVGDKRLTVEKFGIYASSPGSGNAYSRSYLEKVLPMEEKNWRIAADAYLIGLAPFYGSIDKLDTPAGFYRLQNNANVEGGEFSLNHSPGTPNRSVARTIESRHLIWSELAQRGLVTGSGPLYAMTPSDAKVRAISYRFFSTAHPVKNDTAISIFIVAVKATLNWDGYRWKTKTFLCFWFFLILFCPKFLSRGPAIWVSNPRALPKIIKTVKKYVLR